MKIRNWWMRKLRTSRNYHKYTPEKGLGSKYTGKNELPHWLHYYSISHDVLKCSAWPQSLHSVLTMLLFFSFHTYSKGVRMVVTTPSPKIRMPWALHRDIWSQHIHTCARTHTYTLTHTHILSPSHTHACTFITVHTYTYLTPCYSCSIPFPIITSIWTCT